MIQEFTILFIQYKLMLCLILEITRECNFIMCKIHMNRLNLFGKAFK